MRPRALRKGQAWQSRSQHGTTAPRQRTYGPEARMSAQDTGKKCGEGEERVEDGEAEEPSL